MRQSGDICPQPIISREYYTKFWYHGQGGSSNGYLLVNLHAFQCIIKLKNLKISHLSVGSFTFKNNFFKFYLFAILEKVPLCIPVSP